METSHTLQEIECESLIVCTHSQYVFIRSELNGETFNAEFKEMWSEIIVLFNLMYRKYTIMYPLYNGHLWTRKLLRYTEVSFMWRLFYTVRNVIGTLGAVC